MNSPQKNSTPMNNKPFTIQINSLEALERLIGGSTQAEIDIRNAVVQAFTEKHLKAIAADPRIVSAANSIKDASRTAVSDLVTEHIGVVKTTWSGLVESVNLHTKVRNEIDSLVRDRASSLVDAAIKETMAKLLESLAARIAGAVQIRLDYEIGQEVKKQVGEAFRRALENGTK